MSQQSLRMFLAGTLPETATLNQKNAFFERPDVATLMGTAESLIRQIKELWFVTGLPDQLPVPDETSLSTIPTDEQVNDSLPSSDYTVLVDNDANGNLTIPKTDLATSAEGSVETEAALSDSLTVFAPDVARDTGNEINDVPPPTTPTDEPVRFQPTQQLGTPAPQRTLLIPNATVGKLYSYTFDFEALGFPPLAEQLLTVDPANGLAYNYATHTLHGKPIEAGEFIYELTYRPQTAEPNRPMLRRLVQLLVNPDPRSLWKDLPSDSTDRYYKPDFDCNSLLTDTVTLLGASVRGRSHAHEGKFRDDDFSLNLIKSNWCLLAVADGAGSAQYARRGAQLACEALTKYLTMNVTETDWQSLSELVDQLATRASDTITGSIQRQLYNLLGNAALGAYKAIEAEAITAEATTKDFATTLIAVLAKPISGGWFVGGFGVGDGGVGIYQANKGVTLLNTPDGGEYAGQTRFLTMPEVFSDNFFGRFRFAFVPDITAVMLMTDGVTDPKFQTDSNLAKFEKWDEVWNDITQNVTLTADNAPEQLQEWLTFWSPGNHDDRTIAILYPHAQNHSH